MRPIAFAFLEGQSPEPFQSLGPTKQTHASSGFCRDSASLAEANQPDRLIPDGEPLKLALRSKDLDLRALFLQLGEKKPPMTGVLNLDVNAEGTLDDLMAKATLRATRIQSTEAAQFAPADGSLDIESPK